MALNMMENGMIIKFVERAFIAGLMYLLIYREYLFIYY